MAMAEHGVHQDQRLGPGRQAAPAMSVRSATLGLSFTHRGSPQAAEAATASAVAEAEWANIRLAGRRGSGNSR
jgi:hypothetical protein